MSVSCIVDLLNVLFVLFLPYHTKPLGHITHYSYDALDRRIAKTDALGNQTDFCYDKVGRLLGETLFEMDIDLNRGTVKRWYGQEVTAEERAKQRISNVRSKLEYMYARVPSSDRKDADELIENFVNLYDSVVNDYENRFNMLNLEYMEKRYHYGIYGA